MKYQAANEGAVSYTRRERGGFFEKFIKGKRILDIGHGGSPISDEADGWELEQGDATNIDLPAASYDTVYASHILEHVNKPELAIVNWWKLVKPGGHLIIAVPDEDLYEQKVWPSMFNADHKTSWTSMKSCSWSPVSKNLVDLIKLLPDHKLISLLLCDENYDYNKSGVDQHGAERQVEAIIQRMVDTDSLNYLNTLCKTYQCSCGYNVLEVNGFRIDGKLIVRCQKCGQLSMIDIPHTMREISEYNKLNTNNPA